MTDQKQELLGGLIAGKVLEAFAGKAIDKALAQVAESSLSLEKKDVPAVKEALTAAVEKDVAARVEHATNTEPAYQSWTGQGSVVVILGAMTQFADLWNNGVPNTPMEYVPSVTIFVGVGWTIWGRFFAKKPFGR